MLRFPKTLLLLTLSLLAACGWQEPDNPPPFPDTPQQPFLPEQIDSTYYIAGHQIFSKNLGPITPNGVNAMQSFGLVDQTLMDAWNIQIVREFIGNFNEQPLAGGPVQGTDGAWLHPLQTIVDANRQHGRITILCPFGWVDAQGKQTLLTGRNPSDQNFYPDYLIRLRALAEQFKGQPDVWIEVWNEPYHWNNANAYSHERWLRDMSEMSDALRAVPDFTNIILIPGNEQGQSEEALLEKGHQLLEGRYNLLFDLHAYEKWTENSSQQAIEARFRRLQEAELPFLIGELGVLNVGQALPVAPFLAASTRMQVPVLAWLWNDNTPYPNALRQADGSPHADQANNFWGERIYDYLLQNNLNETP
ncbi:MAG: cellulase family glycosylhydrolase [Nitritalea sp.]